MSELIHVLQNLESVSDNSDVELGVMATDIVKISTRKRKWDAINEISGSGHSNCSSPNLPWPMPIGFFRKGSESNEDNGELSDIDGYTRAMVKGYDTATTAVVTDSEDDLFFLDETHYVAEDQFAVEYEPPATDDGGDDDNDDENDEGSLSLHSSDDDNEDPGADGGDEFDEDEDGTDSEIEEDEMWVCPSCFTKNHPMTRHCTGCWNRRHEWLPTGLERSSSAPVPRLQKLTASTLARSNSICASPKIEPLSNSDGRPPCTCPICLAVNFVPPIVDKKVDSHSINHNTGLVNSLPSQPSVQLESIGSDSGISIMSGDTLASSLRDDDPTVAAKELATKTEQSSETVNEGRTQSDVCIICLSQPRNASFVHGHTGHQVCCIDCADKMKATKKRCPVCRKKIQLVVKNFL